jgi:hypothetical protein
MRNPKGMIGAVLFWCVTIVRYVLITVAAMLMSLVVAFLSMSVVIAPGDDSPAIGLA